MQKVTTFLLCCVMFSCFRGQNIEVGKRNISVLQKMKKSQDWNKTVMPLYLVASDFLYYS